MEPRSEPDWDAIDAALEPEYEWMEPIERRIWVKVRCWGKLTNEQAEFLKRLDELRHYVRMPEYLYMSSWRPKE